MNCQESSRQNDDDDAEAYRLLQEQGQAEHERAERFKQALVDIITMTGMACFTVAEIRARAVRAIAEALK